MTDEPTRLLLDRFVSTIRPALPLVSVWAHGSLAGGDYRPGHSDLDLIAVLERPCTEAEEQWLVDMHEDLDGAVPLASGLHCGYTVATEWDDPARSHLTWAHGEIMRRPVTPVTRRELHDFGLVLHGEPPAALLPPVTDRQLADFVITDMRAFWRPSLDRPELWTRDIWVDLGLLTLARATATLQDGRLITKGEALDVLHGLGAPAELVEDVRRRRYGGPGPVPEGWIARRAELTRAFLVPAIERTVAAYRP
ncbi:nucleotidyltransferase domain-containing protein [Streptomyces sp. NPDC014734]|uniref:nucleotidyltransferase domain-containing protein n=1 Tax=Streptomyces sp. NPDC014734 TaxID=3364886 RepID=UPI0036F8059E